MNDISTMVGGRESQTERHQEPWASVSPPLSNPGESDMDHDRPASRTPGPGFLGSTSFSAVYQEEKSLDGLQYKSSHENISANITRRLYMPNRESQIKKGMTCLALLVDFSTFEPILAQWYETYTHITLMSPFTSSITKSVRESIYSAIKNVQGPELDLVLAQKSAEIYRNSMKEFRVPLGATIDVYASTLADPSFLRWDALGIYFTAVGIAACYSNQGVPRAVIEQRRMLAKTMLEASDTCKSLCEELGQMTDAELILYCENAHLVSVVEGDASYMFWRRLGDLISAVITKGLHVNNVSADVPFWLSEMRERVFCHAYNFDKSISSFMGRPPRLPRKYCAMQLPLDIDFTQLRLPADQLEIELGKLDENGWNTAGEFRTNLFSRTSLICNMIREDILELALASLPNDNIAAAENILQRSRSAWNSFPIWIRQMQNNDKAHQESPIFTMLLNEVRLDFRYNEFLLYRAVVKRFPANASSEEELLRLSAATLTSVMESVTRLNLLSKYDCDLPWTLAKFALPTAGVLALELLRESQGLSQRRPKASFNRSAVIQSLSNLVAVLESAVYPFDGNYDICNQAKQVLQQILDRVLSSPVQQRSAASEPGGTATATPEIGAIGSDYLWLNQTSSEPDFWSSLPTHPMLAA